VTVEVVHTLLSQAGYLIVPGENLSARARLESCSGCMIASDMCVNTNL
jgi:hypothetical protein